MISIVFFITIFNFQHWRKVSYRELLICGLSDLAIQCLLVVGIFELIK